MYYIYAFRVGVDLRPPSRKGVKWSKESIIKRSKSFAKNKHKRPKKKQFHMKFV
jgi:hypothetical protein